MDDTRIIKMATLNVGVEHNKKELENSRCVGPDYGVQVLEHHEEFWWLIEESVERLEEERFLELWFQNLGVNQEDFPYFNDLDVREAINTSVTDATESSYPDDFTFKRILRATQVWMNTSPWYQGLVKALKGCHVKSDDFLVNNWGTRPGTNQLILLDLGL